MLRLIGQFSGCIGGCLIILVVLISIMLGIVVVRYIPVCYLQVRTLNLVRIVVWLLLEPDMVV